MYSITLLPTRDHEILLWKYVVIYRNFVVIVTTGEIRDIFRNNIIMNSKTQQKSVLKNRPRSSEKGVNE